MARFAAWLVWCTILDAACVAVMVVGILIAGMKQLNETLEHKVAAPGASPLRGSTPANLGTIPL
jgi:hypothetical protein